VIDTIPKFSLTKRYLKNNTFITNIKTPKQNQELKIARIAIILNIEFKNPANIVYSDA
jgi:hypothetical protein